MRPRLLMPSTGNLLSFALLLLMMYFLLYTLSGGNDFLA